jgi:hypothetical protein
MPPTGGTTGGFSVTVTGRWFGTFDSSPMVAEGRSACSAMCFVSDTSLFCRVAMGMGAALEVTANVNGQAQSVIRMFSYRVPTITSLAYRPIARPQQEGLMSTYWEPRLGKSHWDR